MKLNEKSNTESKCLIWEVESCRFDMKETYKGSDETMKIHYRNQDYEFKEGTTLLQVIGPRELTRIAGVWVNGNNVKKDDCAQYKLNDCDSVSVTWVCAGG